MRPKITTHTIVKNEDRWIWYALKSVIDYVDRLLIYDTGSTDSTVSLIKSLSSSKITFKSTPATTRRQLVQLRQQQLDATRTPWFMLLDGDEVWPQKNLHQLLDAASSASAKTLAFFTHTRNCVGDIFHYLPESKGHYRIKGKTGHLNIRLIRNDKRLKVQGSYPLEAYTIKNKLIQELDDHLEYINTWYLHVSHLPRSSKRFADKQVIDRLKKRKFRLGQAMPKSDLPQVLFAPRPPNVPPPITNRWLQLIKTTLPI